MIGQTWKSEMFEFEDERTGRRITQLTSMGNNVHLYFTENSFDAVENAILFRSDRASGVECAPHEDPVYNLFRLDLDSGEIVQLTDEPHGVHGVTKTPDSALVVWVSDNKIRTMDGSTGEATTVYEEGDGFQIGSPSIGANRRAVAFCRNEPALVYRGPNYGGFKDSYYNIKDGRITMAYLDGSGWLDVWRDTHWLGHFQFSPDDPTLGTFCHEGPWHLVTQRIWLLDFCAHRAWPCFRQGEEDSVGHEFWTRDGYVFFDDRGPGHDGTITSDRTQAVAREVAVKEGTMIPFVGLADRTGQVVRRIEMPYYCNHYHAQGYLGNAQGYLGDAQGYLGDAGPHNRWLVGDDVDELVLIDISGEKAALHVLCDHGTSWHTQSSHCHPTWSWDGSRILFASDRGGRVNLYLVEPGV